MTQTKQSRYAAKRLTGGDKRISIWVSQETRERLCVAFPGDGWHIQTLIGECIRIGLGAMESDQAAAPPRSGRLFWSGERDHAR